MDNSPVPDGIKKKSRLPAIIAVVVVVVVIAAGVSIIELGHHGSTSSKQTLVIELGSGSMTEQYLSMVATNFEKANPNVTVQITTEGYSNLLTSEKSALQGGSSTPNIMMYYASGAPTLGPYLYHIPTSSTGGNGVIDLSNQIAGNMYSGGYRIAPNGTVLGTIGVPIHTVIGYMLVYQKSIFDNATLQSQFASKYHFSFNPRTFQNWTALQDAASFINSSTAFNGTNNNYALLFPNHAAHSIIDGFYNLAYPYLSSDPNTGVPANSSPNYWTYFGNKSGQFSVSFNNSAGVQALEMYKNLTQYEPSVKVSPVGYSEQLTYYETGHYAMGIAWSSFFPDYSNSSQSKVAGNYGVSMLPGGYTGYSPTFLGINPNSPNLTLAVDFLNFATSSTQYGLGITDFSFLPGSSNGLQVAESDPGFGWVSSFLNYSATIHLDPRYAAVVGQVSPLFSTLIPDFNTQVLDYLEGTTTATAALNTAASEWTQTLASDNIVL